MNVGTRQKLTLYLPRYELRTQIHAAQEEIDKNELKIIYELLVKVVQIFRRQGSLQTTQ